MFSDLHEAEIEEILSCFSEASIAAGETLYIEGDAATSACFVIDGELEALKALPGGGETQVGVLGPGSMIGEMALIVGGVRSATVRALAKSTIVKVSYHFFHAALDQMSVPAFKILRGVIRALTTRLDGLETRIFEQLDCEAYTPRSSASASKRPLPEETPKKGHSFDYRPFLSIIPSFDTFTETEIDLVIERAKILELASDEFLYREGTQAEAFYMVVRGAIEHSIVRDRRYQLSIRGPGSLCGANALIAEAKHKYDARVRSGALLLCFDKAAFQSLFLGEATECLKFQNMVSANQLMELKALDNLLTTLVSQSYVLGENRSRTL